MSAPLAPRGGAACGRRFDEALLSGWISASSPVNALRTWAAICRRRRPAAARDLLFAALERPLGPQAEALLRQGLGELLEDREISQA